MESLLLCDIVRTTNIIWRKFLIYCDKVFFTLLHRYFTCMLVSRKEKRKKIKHCLQAGAHMKSQKFYRDCLSIFRIMLISSFA